MVEFDSHFVYLGSNCVYKWNFHDLIIFISFYSLQFHFFDQIKI